jgi:hypothetical protein
MEPGERRFAQIDGHFSNLPEGIFDDLFDMVRGHGKASRSKC